MSTKTPRIPELGKSYSRDLSLANMPNVLRDQIERTSSQAFEDDTKLLAQPETAPATSEQLVNQVKGIYAGLVMVEKKCIESCTLQGGPSSAKSLSNEQWQALAALHRKLLHEHHDFFLASQHPTARRSSNGQWQALIEPHRSLHHEHHGFVLATEQPNSSPAFRRSVSKYAMPAKSARIWRRGIHSFRDLPRNRLPDSLDHVLPFFYLNDSMVVLVMKGLPGLSETRVQRLQDLTRYQILINSLEKVLYDLQILPVAVRCGLQRIDLASSVKGYGRNSIRFHIDDSSQEASTIHVSTGSTKSILQEHKSGSASVASAVRSPPHLRFLQSSMKKIRHVLLLMQYLLIGVHYLTMSILYQGCFICHWTVSAPFRRNTTPSLARHVLSILLASIPMAHARPASSDGQVETGGQNGFAAFFRASLRQIMLWTPITLICAALVLWNRNWLPLFPNPGATSNTRRTHGIASLVWNLALLILNGEETAPQLRYPILVACTLELLQYGEALFPELMEQFDFRPPVLVIGGGLLWDGLLCFIMSPNQGIDVLVFMRLLPLAFWLALTFASWREPIVQWAKRMIRHAGERAVALVEDPQA